MVDRTIEVDVIIIHVIFLHEKATMYSSKNDASLQPVPIRPERSYQICACRDRRVMGRDPKPPHKQDIMIMKERLDKWVTVLFVGVCMTGNLTTDVRLLCWPKGDGSAIDGP